MWTIKDSTVKLMKVPYITVNCIQYTFHTQTLLSRNIDNCMCLLTMHRHICKTHRRRRKYQLLVNDNFLNSLWHLKNTLYIQAEVCIMPTINNYIKHPIAMLSLWTRGGKTIIVSCILKEGFVNVRRNAIKFESCLRCFFKNLSNLLKQSSLGHP